MKILLFLWLPFAVFFLACRIRSLIVKGRTLLDWYLPVGILIAPVWFFGLLWEEGLEAFIPHLVIERWKNTFHQLLDALTRPE